MIRKAISGIGFVLMVLGIACVDSPSILIPAAMMVSGGAMLWASAGWEREWTEK